MDIAAIGNFDARDLVRRRGEEKGIDAAPCMLREHRSSADWDQVHKAADASVECFASPGDVLFVHGTTTWLTGVGTAGGPLGHMMLIVEEPHRIQYSSEKGCWLRPVWPSDAVVEVWMVRVIESSRSNAGLHQADILMYLSETGQLILIGEVTGGHVDTTEQLADLWQSPEILRRQLSAGLVNGVLQDMRSNCANWSWATAALALLLSSAASLRIQPNIEESLREIKKGWAAEPICTSVVVSFWQRLLCKLAAMTGGPPESVDAKAADMIMKWMPLRADRCSPGQLMDAMQKSGWTVRTAIPVGRGSDILGDCCPRFPEVKSWVCE